MITIQGFAKLCGCNAQTLRFYDRIGLLTPAKVDSPVLGTGFPSLMLAAMAVKTDAIKGGMTCNTARSDDGRNHFALYQK